MSRHCMLSKSSQKYSLGCALDMWAALDASMGDVGAKEVGDGS